MDELKRKWANRALASADDSDGNFWAVMASDAPLSNENVGMFRSFILQELATESDLLLTFVKRSGVDLSGCDAKLDRIAEMIDQYAAISDMLSYPHHGMLSR